MLDTLAATSLWFERARPNPTTRDFHSQLGCHFEEVAELVSAISTYDAKAQELLEDARITLTTLADHLKRGENFVFIQEAHQPEFLDALCDGIVTAVGVAYTHEMDIQGAMLEVNRSNFSKFDKEGRPIRCPQTHKVLKGPNYSKADLTPFV